MQRPLNRVNACTARIVCTVRFRHGEIHIFQLGRVLASRVPLRPAIGGKATLSRQRSIVRFGRSTVNERILAARSELVGDSVETRAEAVTPRSLLFVDLFRVARFRMAAVVQLDLPGKARAKVTEERETRSPVFTILYHRDTEQRYFQLCTRNT